MGGNQVVKAVFRRLRFNYYVRSKRESMVKPNVSIATENQINAYLST